MPKHSNFSENKLPFQVQFYRIPDSKYLSRHSHDEYEIWFMLSGELFYFVKDRTYLLKKGNILFIASKELHFSNKPKASDYSGILLKFSKKILHNYFDNLHNYNLFASFYNGSTVINLDSKAYNFVESILRSMVKENNKREPGFYQYSLTLLIQLIIYTNRLIADPQSTQLNYPSYLHEKISEVAKYISRNYMKQISLDHLSDHFYLSPYYLSRCFKKVSGFSFVDYLNSIRIKESKTLLCETSLKITHISGKVGYNSITHFNRMFKKITGTSPKIYRKNNKTILPQFPGKRLPQMR